MEMHKIHAIQRYQAEQIHLDRSSAYDSGLQSKSTQSSFKSKKTKISGDQDQRFQELLNAMLDVKSDP